MQSDLSIIVPTYNEQDNVLNLVERIDQTMRQNNVKYEIIFIDDNSTDLTRETIMLCANSYPISLSLKQGTRGKAYSILEGSKKAKYENICMIDADLQYPPEAIVEMLGKLETNGVVVANRKEYNDSFLRGLLHNSFSFVFGTLLHGFDFDVQSGLKLFKKEIIEQIETNQVSPWTIDLRILTTAKNMGYSIGTVDITFDERKFGESKVNFLKTSKEIGLNALKIKFNQQRIFHLKPSEGTFMANAGVIHKKKKLITHTTLHHDLSALQTITKSQIGFVMGLLLFFAIGFLVNPMLGGITLIGFLTVIYFIDVLFNLFVVFKSLHNPPEILATDEDLRRIDESKLPIYSVLVPLYREAHILPQFLKNIAQVDWPKNKLEVLILLEENDLETQQAAKELDLPNYVKVVIVPDSQPKTKPKACNYGLNFVTGEYLVIYDAEDKPDSDQLKKAYYGFMNSEPNVVCLQGKLNYFNPNQNLLTRFFTAEYSLWFDVILPGLQSVKTALPLGGTSNHFKVSVLKELKGWDPFNVTEDCDLGVRLFKAGYKTSMIDSTTLEEANSNTKNWLRQRSRWIKGYMQTYLVHMRHPVMFVKEFGFHALLFQLIIGARISFMLINPFLWLMTISYFTLFQYVGPTIEALYPSWIFYMAVFSLIFGNFSYIYNYMIGVAKKEHWQLMKYVYLIPVYWLLASIAASIAFYQLITKPHYWEKTNHGLHLKKQEQRRGLTLLAPVRYVASMFI